MEIEQDRVVAFDYVLTDDAGTVIDQSSPARGPMYYLHGHGNIVPGLEKALAGLSAGAEFSVSVPPSEGYGERDEARTFEIPKSELGPQVTPQKGMTLTMTAPNGAKAPVTIAKVRLNTVVLDGNHVLAGKTLHFKGTVREVRKAKKEELAHRHAHAPGHPH